MKKILSVLLVFTIGLGIRSPIYSEMTSEVEADENQSEDVGLEEKETRESLDNTQEKETLLWEQGGSQIPLADAAVTNIEDANTLLTLLNATGATLVNKQYVVTKNITIDTKDLSALGPVLKNSSLIGALDGNEQAPVTITFTNRTNLVEIRQMFKEFDQVHMKNFNLVFEGDTQAAVIALQVRNNSVVDHVNIHIKGNVRYISLKNMIGYDNVYFATAAFCWVRASTIQNMKVLVDQDVGLDTQDTGDRTVYASGFIYQVSEETTLQNIDVHILGKVYANGKTNGTGAAGFAHNLEPVGSSVIQNNTITIGSEQQPTGIIAISGGDHGYSVNYVGGLFGMFSYEANENISENITIENNTILVYGDIRYEGQASLQRVSIISASGFGTFRRRYETNENILTIRNNSIDVRGDIACIGKSKVMAGGGVNFINSGVEGVAYNNNIRVQNIYAEMLFDDTTMYSEAAAYASGFGYQSSTGVSHQHNSIEVEQDISVKSGVQTKRMTAVAVGYATFLTTPGIENAIENTVLIKGNIAIASLGATGEAQAAGFSYYAMNTKDNHVVIEGDINASAGNIAYVGGYASYLSGAQRNSVDIQGNILVKSDTKSNYIGGFVALGNGDIHQNRVDIKGSIIGNAKGTSSVGGFTGGKFGTGNGSYQNNSVYIYGDVQLSGQESVYAGGFFGLLEGNATISHVFEHNIAYIEGKVRVSTTSTSEQKNAIVGGFAGWVGNNITIKNSAVFVKGEVQLDENEKVYRSKGSFAGITYPGNGQIPAGKLMGCTLLSLASKTRDMRGAYSDFVGSHYGDAMDMYVVEVAGENRTAFSLVYNGVQEQWESGQSIAEAKVKNTNQIKPTFLHVLQYTGTDPLVYVPTYDTQFYTVDTQSYPYSITLNEHYTSVPHGALQALVGTDSAITYDLFGVRAEAIYTVTFDSKGGSAVAEIEDVSEGSRIAEPTTPTYQGYTFIGWYKDETYQNKWDFEKDEVRENLILYARWQPKEAEVNFYTIRFDSQGGSEIPAMLKVKEKTSIQEPTNIIRKGYKLIGWYMDRDYQSKWDFAKDVIEHDMTLYAKWEKINDKTEEIKSKTKPVDTRDDENMIAWQLYILGSLIFLHYWFGKRKSRNINT